MHWCVHADQNVSLPVREPEDCKLYLQYTSLVASLRLASSQLVICPVGAPCPECWCIAVRRIIYVSKVQVHLHLLRNIGLDSAAYALARQDHLDVGSQRNTIQG